MKETEILLDTGTNELEILEMVIEDLDHVGEVRQRFFGINVAKVMQVIENPGLKKTKSSENPAFLGMISIRGQMAPVLDLAIMLGVDRAVNKTDVIIVTEFSQSVLGFMVTDVVDIHRLGWGRIDPPDKCLGLVARGIIVGLVNMQDRYIQVLDIESLLAELVPETLDLPCKTAVTAARQYKALVADDSETIRIMLRKVLTAANMQPTLVNTGEEALSILEKYKAESQNEKRPLSDFVDILITDIEMPRMDGYSLTKMVKSDPLLKDLPVILYSSLIYDEVLHKGESVLADVQISKPEMHRMAELALELLEK
ncbi:response regulator [Desulfolutivibrio sulfoxidireducens]|nr:response regulator [Desulfolutivibrio sulfoxidireducens]